MYTNTLSRLLRVIVSNSCFSTVELFSAIAGQLKHLLICGAGIEFMLQEVSAEAIAEVAVGKTFASVLDELVAMRQQIERVRNIVQEVCVCVSPRV